jgi:hypothetical protein
MVNAPAMEGVALKVAVIALMVNARQSAIVASR